MQNTYKPLQEYLTKNNQPFSMDALKALATSKGLTTYSGTDAENNDLATRLGLSVPVGSASTQAIVNSGIMQSTTQQDRKDTATASRVDQIAPPTAGSAMGTPIYEYENGNAAGKQTLAGYRKPDGTVEYLPGFGTNKNNSDNASVNNDGTPKKEPTYEYSAPDGTQISMSPLEGGYQYTSQTRLADGEKFGYGADGKRYIVGKDGTIKNDAFADQEYATNKKNEEREKQRNELYDKLKTNLDTAHAGLLDSIKKQFDARRVKQQDINRRYLALKQTQGFSSGMAQYMGEANTQILEKEESDANQRLADLDAQEQELTAKAVQAKADDDLALAQKHLDELDKIADDKMKAIQDIYKASQDYNKALDDQEKKLADQEKALFERGQKTLETSAPAIQKAYDSLKTDVERTQFIATIAKKMALDPAMVLGSIEQTRMDVKAQEALTAQRDRSNRGKAGGDDTEEDFGTDPITGAPLDQAGAKEKADKQLKFLDSVDQMIATKFKNSAGVPVVTAKGFLTYEAFKDLWADAQKLGITREMFLSRYRDKLNLKLFSKDKTGYGLTDAEYNKLK